MQTASQSPTKSEPGRSNRNLPVEQWPESLEILRHLAAHSDPRAVKDVAKEVCAPEISTRNRLARLEAAGTVRAVRMHGPATVPGKPTVALHYAITQYGRDCAACSKQAQVSSAWTRVNSVFSWASTPETSS